MLAERSAKVVIGARGLSRQFEPAGNDRSTTRLVGRPGPLKLNDSQTDSQVDPFFATRTASSHVCANPNRSGLGPFLRLRQQQPRSASKNPAPPRERCNRRVRDTQ